ncbi:hypothetical protein I9018_15310 [Pseudomonas sp. MPFS]|nr:hypothetical protein I9018_15310 [Pseudomonas sp. MPFS]
MVTAALEGFLSTPMVLTINREVLARLNLHRWQHSCVHLKHVFVRMDQEEVQIALLDFEKALQRLTTRRSARHDSGKSSGVWLGLPMNGKRSASAKALSLGKAMERLLGDYHRVLGVSGLIPTYRPR